MLKNILEVATRKGASDIHLKAGSVPIFRKHGELAPMAHGTSLTSEEIHNMALQVMNEREKEKFLNKLQVDLSFGISNLGRFRLNIFKQRGSTSIVIRLLSIGVPPLASLHLPKIIQNLALSEKGLILVTGVTGAGKSTTLASMVDHINTHVRKHILTIEDPIEFLIKDKNSLITQRELGSDAIGFHEALVSSLRQDPDVILIGEIRDKETIETALLAAATGHLVLSTLHTLHATETVNRIVGLFPGEQQYQVRLQLASVLRAVISQRLTRRPDGQGFAPAVEILINNTRIREMIQIPDKTHKIAQAVEEGHVAYGMQTFDQSLMNLVTNGVISYDEALRHSTSPEDFSIRYSGIVRTDTSDDKRWEDESKYENRIHDKWENIKTLELESIDETTDVGPDKDIRIKSSRRKRSKQE